MIKNRNLVVSSLILSMMVSMFVGLAVYGPVKSASFASHNLESNVEFVLGEPVVIDYSIFYINVIPRLYSKLNPHEMYVTDGNGTTIYSSPIAMILAIWTFYINDFGNITWDQTVYVLGQPVGNATLGNYMMHTYFGDFNFSIVVDITF